MSDITPLFLFSLPRSGSTLVQRILATQDQITTTSESWLLLPFLYSLKDEGIYAEYGHNHYRKARDDFLHQFDRQKDDYLDELRSFARRLYTKASDTDTAAYFLDKTPRYHLVAPDIMRLFPEAKFIILWRNPLALTASMMQTWQDGHWNLYLHKADLYKGLATLVRTFEQNEDRVCSIRYENLLLHQEETSRKLFDYLGLPYDSSALSTFEEVKLEGRMGDQWGSQDYQHIDREPLEKWKAMWCNPLRKMWMRRYLNWIGADRLRTMGYELGALLDDLAGVPSSARYLASDTLRMTQGALHPWLEPKLMRDKRKKWPSVADVLPHT